MLAELDLEYRVIPVDITAGKQFEPEFLKINPNNKVPAIVDHDGPHNKPYAVFESAVVLLYLAEKSGKFLSQDPAKRYDTRKLHRRDLSEYPNIDRWYQAIKDRPGVRAGIDTLSDSKQWEAKPGTDAWKNMFGKNGSS